MSGAGAFCAACGAEWGAARAAYPKEPSVAEARTPYPERRPAGRIWSPAAKLFAVAIVVIIVAGAWSGISNLVISGGVPNGTYRCGYGSNHYGRGGTVSFLGRTMMIENVASTTLLDFEGRYRIENGLLYMKPKDEEDISLLAWFYDTENGYVVFDYRAGVNGIWLDGVEFTRQ
jgi:hypothetical protein